MCNLPISTNAIIELITPRSENYYRGVYKEENCKENYHDADWSIRNDMRTILNHDKCAPGGMITAFLEDETECSSEFIVDVQRQGL